MTRRALALALVVAIGATGAAIAAVSWSRQANQACAVAGTAVERLPKANPGNLIAEITATAKIAQRLVGQLRAIHPPPNRQAPYRRFVNATAAQVTDANAAVSAMKHRQKGKTTAALAKLAAAGRLSDRLASQLRLPACAQDYAPQG